MTNFPTSLQSVATFQITNPNIVEVRECDFCKAYFVVPNHYAAQKYCDDHNVGKVYYFKMRYKKLKQKATK